jgi:hypothetical protein
MGSDFIMSDFKLVADSPYPIPSREVLQLKPDVLKIPTKFSKIILRQQHQIYD